MMGVIQWILEGTCLLDVVYHFPGMICLCQMVEGQYKGNPLISRYLAKDGQLYDVRVEGLTKEINF